MSDQKIPRAGIIAAIILSVWSCQAIGQGDGNLRLELACEIGNDGMVRIISTLSNESDQNQAVLIGVRLGNGRTYHSTALSITATSAVTGEASKYEYLLAFVAGRADPWIQPLPAGSSFSWRLRLDDFFSSERNQKLSVADWPIDAAMQLESRPIEDIAFLEGFVGQLDSPAISIPTECAGGA